MVRVPRSWPDATVVCLGTGPSLAAEDVAFVRDKARVIAVNDAYRLAPWADALYATDVVWWHHHQGAPTFTGTKWSLDHPAWRRYEGRWPDIQRLAYTGDDGIDVDPSGLRSGKNSGYAAINLAVHYGARRIVLLGYDMSHQSSSRTHFFGNHPWKPSGSPYAVFLAKFQTAVAPLAALGIDVVNCSRVSALTGFPRRSLADVLRAEVAA